MVGKYGKNQWKLRLLSLSCVIIIMAIVIGVTGNVLATLLPKYKLYEESVAARRKEERRQEESRREKRKEREREAAELEEAERDREEAQDAEYQAEQAEEATEFQNSFAESDYIIADSASRYLGYEDVQNLSLQQINYAKNEIYARRGRKFKSWELQNYFNSKSWYNPTIEPDSFSESIFNEYEKANAKFLSDRELERDSRGYRPK